MERTQIYLDKQLKDALAVESKLSKKKISQVIRDILREKLIDQKSSNYSLGDIAGIWKDRDFDVDDYIRDKRKGDRLSRIYNE